MPWRSSRCGCALTPLHMYVEILKCVCQHPGCCRASLPGACLSIIWDLKCACGRTAPAAVHGHLLHAGRGDGERAAHLAAAAGRVPGAAGAAAAVAPVSRRRRCAGGQKGLRPVEGLPSRALVVTAPLYRLDARCSATGRMHSCSTPVDHLLIEGAEHICILAQRH
jgi:hypothetical protein